MIYQKHPNMVARKIMDEVILVPVSRNVADMQSIFTLNETGARVWELLDGKNSEEDIVRTLVEECEVDQAKVREDVAVLISQLKEIKAITQEA